MTAFPLRLTCLACLLGWLIGPPATAAEQPWLDIRDFGAKPDGETLATEAIQQAVDRCASNGGGTVLIPAGRWLVGTVYLADNVTVYLQAGSTVLGSRNIDDYGHPRTNPGAAADTKPYQMRAIFAGMGLENVALCGSGTIDGQGEAFKDRDRPRTKTIHLVGCRRVRIAGLSLKNAGSWMQHYADCEDVELAGLNVFNHAAYNNDGMNIDSCRNVRVRDSIIDSDDDALVLKSLSTKPCEDITVTGCILSSHCNALKMGTESGGGFRGITATNCTIHSPRHSEKIYGQQRGLAGIALEIVDGGEMERIAISNTVIEGVTTPIFLRLGNRARVYTQGSEKPGVGRLHDVSISNIVATGASPVGCSITGLPGHPIENVSLANVQLEFEGGESREAADRDISERPEAYPESTMFGTLPAYGLYCRHVQGLAIDGLRLRTIQPDGRHALVFDDVRELSLAGLAVKAAPEAAAVVRMSDARDALVHGCRVETSGTFLAVTGSDSREILLTGNQLQAGERLSRGEDVPDGAVTLEQ